MVTNDGATILKSIALDNAAAKVLVNISKVQDDEVGDGTTSVTVLAAELLREAEKLVDKKIHPQTIIEGYRIASARRPRARWPTKSARGQLGQEPGARSGKTCEDHRPHHAQLQGCSVKTATHFAAAGNVDAVLRMKRLDGPLTHSGHQEGRRQAQATRTWTTGFILDKRFGVNQPKRIENAKILVANTAMDTDKIKIFGARRQGRLDGPS